MRIRSRHLIATLLLAALLPACDVHRRTIREYHTDQGGRVSVSNVTEEEYWKERVDERIAAEIAKEKPEAGYDTWQNYWRWGGSVFRREKKTPFKTNEFQKAAGKGNYIQKKRRAKRISTHQK